MLVKLVVSEGVVRGCSIKKVFLEISQNSQENTCARVSFLLKLFIKKETLPQVFSCVFCEISKNNFFMEHPRMTASVVFQNSVKLVKLQLLVSIFL